MNHRVILGIVPIIVFFLLPLPGRAEVDLNFVPNEVLVSDPTMGLRGIIDPEVDSLNSQFCWIDRRGSLWVGYIDPATGLFDPTNGRGRLIDTDAVTVGEIGNGPEWVYTNVGPQIAYTKHVGPAVALARAYYQGGGVWTNHLLENGYFRLGPIGTLDRGDTTPKIAYQGPNNGGTRAIYVRDLTDASTEQMIPTTDMFRTPGARWIPGKNAAIFTRPMPSGTLPPRQVFSYDMDLQQLEQLTFDTGNKIAVFMWQAPEYNDEYVFFALIGKKKLGLYRRLDQDGDGIAEWTRIQIIDPPSTGDYIWSPEPFVYQGKSYLMMVTSTSDDQKSLTVPSEIWLTDIDPVDPLYRKISDAREVNRKDPEIYFSEQGPYVYASVAEQVDGPDMYRFDTGLGPQAQAAALLSASGAGNQVDNRAGTAW